MKLHSQKIRLAVLIALLPMSIVGIVAQENETAQPQTASAGSRLGTPIYELLAFRPEETTHISELDDELIVAQIAVFKDENQARLFLKNHSTIYISGVRLEQDEETKYVVYIGLYEDDDSARWAHESFAERNPRFLTSNFKRVRLGDLKPHILRAQNTESQ